jgi:rhodanese-related sulfurtransferase
MKIFLFLIIFLIYAKAINPMSLPLTGFEVTHTYLNGKKENYKIERMEDKNCLNIAVTAEVFNEKNIKENIHKECKKTFITVKGMIQPLFISEDIKTVAEIEVLDFIYNKSSKTPNKYALIDTRKASWFNQQTIPSAINVPFEDMKYDEDFKKEFYKAYENLGIKVINPQKNIYDFSNTKTAIFFCNAPWCSVSTNTIKYLLKIGYPANKILWYRGGMADWSSMSLSVTKEVK